MRTRSKVLIAVGAAFAVVAGLWTLIAPGQLVKYPSDVDKTAVATGTYSLFVNPSTGTRRAEDHCAVQGDGENHLPSGAEPASGEIAQKPGDISAEQVADGFDDGVHQLSRLRRDF